MDRKKKRILVVEDGLHAAGRLMRALRILGSDPIHITYLESMEDGRLVGWSNIDCLRPVEVEVREIQRAYIDYDLGSCSFNGCDIVRELRSSGVERIVGISSDRSFNGRLQKAGAKRSRSKSEIIYRLECWAERKADGK